MSERTITNAIMRYLKTLDGWCMKIHGSSMQMSGVPDILYVEFGRAFWFEVKRPNGNATKLQRHRLQELQQAGCGAWVVNSVQDVKDKLYRWNAGL